MTDDGTDTKVDGARVMLVTTCFVIMDKERDNV